MIDTDEYDYENIQKWVVSGNTVLSVAPPENRIVASNLTIQDAQLIADAPDLLAEVKRLREESKKKGDVLTTLDEMIRNYASHVEMMKALEQGLDLPETWKEMIE